MFEYSVSMEWSDEDDGYIARIPEFPNLSAFGSTPEEALAEARSAAEMMLDVLREDGEQLPEPRKSATYSGQIRLRLPKTLHRNLAIEANKEGVSLNTLIVSGLSEYMGRKKERSALQSTTKFAPLSEPRRHCIVSVSEEQQSILTGEVAAWSPGGTWYGASTGSDLDLYDTTPWPRQDGIGEESEEQKG